MDDLYIPYVSLDMYPNLQVLQWSLSLLRTMCQKAAHNYVEVTVVKQGASDVNVTILLSTVDGTAIR